MTTSPENHRAIKRKYANSPKGKARQEEWNRKNRATVLETKRRHNFKRRYGLTWDAYLKMVKEQEARCKICSAEVELVVDHDHATGEVRGLLCRICNLLLGAAKDNDQILLSAALYLRRHNDDTSRRLDSPR